MSETQIVMDLQPRLAPSVRSSGTSVAAARAIEPHLGHLQAKVLSYFLVDAGFDRCTWTCDEIEATSGMLHTTVSARLRDLVKLGKIVDSGMRRPTRSGRPATVYRLA